MVSSQYIFKGRSVEPKISGFVRNFFASAHESSNKGGFVRIYEDSSVWNKRNYIVLLRVDTTESEEGVTRVEAIVAGGDEIFSGEGRKISFSRALQDFCEENLINYEAV